MTLSDYLTFATIAAMISGAITGIFMYFDKRKNTQLIERGTSADYLLDTNQAIEIANRRAVDAEKERRNGEVAHKAEVKALREEFGIRFDVQQVENAKLRDEVAALRKEIAAIAYEIKLVAQLGDDPKVETVTIKRIPATAAK
jgi:hypothetical protein